MIQIQPSAYGVQAYQQFSNASRPQEANLRQNAAAPVNEQHTNQDQVSLTGTRGESRSQVQGTDPNNQNTDRQSSPTSSQTATANGQELDDADIKQLKELQKRDTEVRAHEAAHLAAAGQHAAGGASFTFQTGPDGRRYAVGGEVPIDMSKESTPEATIQKMQTVKRAALAPANPSSADRQIAARATMKISEASSEILAAQYQQDESSSTPAISSEEERNTSAVTPRQSTSATNDGAGTATLDTQPPTAPHPDANRMTMMVNAYKAIASMA